MTYEEALVINVTKSEALAEIEIHDIDPKEFLEEIGDSEEYAGADVLAWLGY